MSMSHGGPQKGSGVGNWTKSAANEPSQREPSFGDSSGKFFSMYCDAAEEEDKEMVERWQKDAEGILIFTGLFSAAVAALLAVTVVDLKPNSQDTSAFYLGNIYEFLADPNVTHASVPSPVAQRPPFSPPRYAVWVNSLWFLSLVMGLSCALLAMSLQQWARRYLRFTQPARCSPEKRARMRGFFANGADKMYIPWAVEGLPTLLHFSVFFFFAGLVIYLFNVNHEVFTYVTLWIGIFSMVYALITLLPLIRPDSPYYAPLSTPAWFLYIVIQYTTFKFLTFITSHTYGSLPSCWQRYRDSRDRYRRWILEGMEKRVEEAVSEQSSEIDIGILEWTISALGNDDSLEEFFEAIPGLFKSKLVEHLVRDFPVTLLETFWSVLDGFMGRTLSSNSIKESVKSHRIAICRDIMSIIPGSINHRHNNLRSHFGQVPVSIETLQAMTRWFTRSPPDDVSRNARLRAAENLAIMRERDDRWVELAGKVYGLSEDVLRPNVALGGDNALLATLIGFSHEVTRQARQDETLLVGSLTQFDIHHTLPELQHNFCALWNELVRRGEGQWNYIIPKNILRFIQPLHTALHPGTDTTPTSTPPPFTRGVNPTLFGPRTFSLCDITSHHPDSASHHITDLPIVGSSTPVAPPPPRAPPQSGAEFISLLRGTTPSRDSRPTGNAILPRLRARGLVNTGNISFANAVLQLLVHSPPFWDLFRELGDLNGLRGAGRSETGGGAIPLVDATMRFIEEFKFKEKEPLSTLQSPQQAARGKTKEDKGAKLEHNVVDSFEPTYMYEAMRKKMQLKRLLDDGQQRDAEEFFRLYLDTLDEELLALVASISTHKPDVAASGVEEREISQSGLTEARKRGLTMRGHEQVNFVESPIMRIFGGKSWLSVHAPNQPDSVIVKDWRSLQLDIRPDSVHTLQGALAHISQPQSVQVGPSGLRDAAQQVPVKVLPPILVLHLGRFQYDATAGSVIKIGKSIQVDPELNIPLDIMVPPARVSAEPAHYKLYGMLYHHGESVGSGHYTVDVLHHNGDGGSGEAWLHIDDEVVSLVRHEDVFGGHDNEQVDSRCVYMLFYCRTFPTQT